MKPPKIEQWRTEGRFWAGDNEQDSVHGTLIVYEGGRSELHLAGIFQEDASDLFGSKAKRVPIITGITEKYRYISMLNALETNRTLRSNGLDRAKYTATRMFASESGHNWENQYVLELVVGLEGLEEWLGTSGFQIHQDFDEYLIDIHYKLPNTLTFALNDGMSVEFGFRTNGITRTNPQLEVSIKQSTYFTIKSDKPRELESHLNYAQTVADLICLGIGEATGFYPLEARFAVPSTELNGMWANPFFAMNSTPDVDVPHPLKMLFNFGDVQNEFGQMISTWTANVSVIKATYQLYFATVRSSGMYPEHRFFNFFQALESFHRLRYKNQLIPDTTCMTPQSPSAGMRIKDLVARFECYWIFASPWQDAIERTTKVRNYLVHNDRRPPDEDLTSLSLINAGSRLQMLCEIVLLSQAGFDNNKANRTLQSKARDRRLIYQ